MRTSDCLRILGLPMTATRREVKRAYRRLAIRLHPDKQPGNDDARRRFIELSNAYHLLMGLLRAGERAEAAAECAECGRAGEVVRGLDGRLLCRQCLLRPGASRLLPLPRVVVARCVASSVLVIAAGAFLFDGWLSGSRVTLVLAAAAGCLSLLTLTATCLRIRHCTDRQEMRRANRRAGA